MPELIDKFIFYYLIFIFNRAKDITPEIDDEGIADLCSGIYNAAFGYKKKIIVLRKIFKIFLNFLALFQEEYLIIISNFRIAHLLLHYFPY